MKPGFKPKPIQAGFRFHAWTVIKELPRTKTNPTIRRFRCKCKCGNIVDNYYNTLVSDNSKACKSCGHKLSFQIRKKRIKFIKQKRAEGWTNKRIADKLGIAVPAVLYFGRQYMPGFAKIYYHDCSTNKRRRQRALFLRASSRASKSKIPFSIDFEKLKFPKYCPVLKLKLKYQSKKSCDPASASLDRIDNNKGYTPENVRVISFRANRLKSNGTLKEFLAISRYIKECLSI